MRFKQLIGALVAAAVLATPASAKTLRWSSQGDILTFDPMAQNESLNNTFSDYVYDGLVRYNKQFVPEPALATSWTRVSPTQWRFNLRKNVKFHDGTPFTAEDVKAVYERNMAPGKTVVTAGFATIDKIEAVTPTSLRITTKKPDPLMPVRMAQMGGYIYPKRFATDDGAKELARKPVGTGAYRFVEWIKDDRLVMEANGEWWGWGGKPPAVDRLIWKPIPDDFARLSALQRGEVDVITNVPPDQMKIVKTLAVTSSRFAVLSMNTTQAPLSDKRVRQALHYALDMPSIVKNLYAGQGKPFSGGVADTDFGFNPALKPYPYDPAKAKALLAEAGYAGQELTMHAGFGTMVNDKQLLETIADMWSQVGVKAKVEMMEMARRQKMNNDRSTPPNGMLLGNPQSTLLDIDGCLWRIFHPNGFNGKYWVGSQPGHRFHDIMEQGRYSLDQKKRKDLYVEATRIIHEEKPWIELFQEVVIYGVSKRVTFKPRADFRLIAAEMTATR
jgi:peptide/nickel transport system substrate-binding protein